MDRAYHDPPARPAARASGADELASRFDDVLRAVAAAGGPEDFHRGVADMTERLAAHRPEIADMWQAFVNQQRATASANLLKNSGVHPTRVIGRAKETVRRTIEAQRPASDTTPGIDDGDLRPGDHPRHADHAKGAAEPARPYLRASGPEVHTAPDVATTDGPRPASLQLPDGGEIQIQRRHHAPGGPLPPGWVAEPFGRWHGRDAEVVYNPRRHDVIVTNGVQLAPDEATSLGAIGFERCARADDRELWTRDRLAATRAALTRLDQGAAIRPDGPELRPAIGLER